MKYNILQLKRYAYIKRQGNNNAIRVKYTLIRKKKITDELFLYDYNPFKVYESFFGYYPLVTIFKFLEK